jgi:two-component system sensor histidine kinase KdpD
LLSGIDQETDRLNRMVGDILALSRLEAEAWRPQCEIVTVEEVIGATLDAFNNEENGRIRVTIESGLPEVSLDSVQIVQVLHNLLENALKYSPPGSPVELQVRRERDMLTIEVMDRGFGLPAGEETAIFERFYRARQWRESSLPGTGIGLAIGRGLAEAHGGTLDAENRPLGGSVFRLRLPLTSGEKAL